MKRLLPALLPIFCVVFLSGCNFNLFGTSPSAVHEEEIDKKFKEYLDDLNENPPPSKSLKHRELEKKVVDLADKHMREAMNMSANRAVRFDLSIAGDLMESLKRSLGLPSATVEKSEQSAREIIGELDEENSEFAQFRDEYEDAMADNMQTIARLQAVLDSKIIKEQSLFSKVKTWFWIAICLSIAIAVLVPGGIYIVRRMWVKTAQVGITAAKVASNAGAELSAAVGRYMEEVRSEEERQKLAESLSSMSEEAKAYWKAHKRGRHVVNEAISKMPRGIIKKMEKKSGGDINV